MSRSMSFLLAPLALEMFACFLCDLTCSTKLKVETVGAHSTPDSFGSSVRNAATTLGLGDVVDPIAVGYFRLRET